MRILRMFEGTSFAWHGPNIEQQGKLLRLSVEYRRMWITSLFSAHNSRMATSGRFKRSRSLSYRKKKQHM